MTNYYIYKTEKNDRWDKIASKFYGDCFKIVPIIEANPHLPISSKLEEGIEMRIPILEDAQKTEGLPIWKQ